MFILISDSNMLAAPTSKLAGRICQPGVDSDLFFEFSDTFIHDPNGLFVYIYGHIINRRHEGEVISFQE